MTSLCDDVVDCDNGRDEYCGRYIVQSESKLINGVAGKTTGHVILI
jgi:hypothetical protein